MSEDVLDKYIVPSIKEFATKEEIAKLNELDKKAEELHTKVNKLEKERSILRNNLKPDFFEEKKKFQEVRDVFLKVNSMKMKELKEERKQINEKFKNSTVHIREERKKQLKEDPELAENLKQKNLFWEECQKTWKDFHSYMGQLNERYKEKKNE